MANTIIQIRSSGVTGNVPQTLQPGEIAINYVDGKLFYGNSSNQPVVLDTITEPAGLNGEIQFNSSGSFGSDEFLTYDTSSKSLTANNLFAGSMNVAPTILSAYLHANSAYAYANALSGGTATDGVARSIANSAYTQANASYSQSNTATEYAQSAGSYANSAYLHANSAFSAANNATDTWVRTAANSASSYANSAYTQANTATTNAATADQRAVTSGSYANSAYSQANTATTNAATADQRAVTSGSYANSAYAKANTAAIDALSAGSYANSAYTKANTASIDATSAGSYANSAYAKANNALANTTGTFAGSLTLTGSLTATSITTTGSSGDISGANVVYANTFTANTRITTPALQVTGDTTITGNLTVTGQTSYANTTTVNLGDNIITLNADIPQASAPSENAGIEIDRGSSANVQLIWNESTDKWTFTNDGTNYSDIASSAAESYANSAFSKANTATTNAATADQRAVTSGVYANSAYLHANSAFDAANNATDTWVRTAANSASSYANSAYRQANTGTLLAQAAFDYANTLPTTGGGGAIGVTNDTSTNAEYYITFTDTTSGNLSSLSVSDTKLSYNPSSGALSVEVVDLTSNVSISSNSFEDLSGSQFLFDSFDATSYRGAFYQVQIESPGQYQVLNLNIVHDGGTPTVSTFGNTFTSSSLGSFTATIVGGVLQVLFTPNVGQVIVSFVRNIIKKIKELLPAGDLGYVADTATVAFDAGYVGDSSSSSFDYGGLN